MTHEHHWYDPMDVDIGASVRSANRTAGNGMLHSARFGGRYLMFYVSE